MSKHVLITGATKGIGRACAERFAAAGWAITAVARTAEDLAELAASLPANSITTVEADLMTADGVALVPDAQYDAIILNAAAFQPGPLLSGEEDAFTKLWATNVTANHLLARTRVPRMVQRGEGHLLTIGSLGTDFWPAHLTAYVATKYALRGLFRGWQTELAGTGVLTTLIAPGATLTSSWENETPPPDILAPETVAEVVFRAVAEGTEGRVVVA